MFTVVAPWAGALARRCGVDMFDNAAALRRVSCRVAFVHSTDDRLIRLRDHCLPNLAAVPHADKQVWRTAGPHHAEPPRAMALGVLRWLQFGY